MAPGGLRAISLSGLRHDAHHARAHGRGRQVSPAEKDGTSPPTQPPKPLPAVQRSARNYLHNLGLDAFTHSLAAFRLTPGSDSSIEVAMLLWDVMLPLPMRPDWTPDMEWHYPGVPAALVTEFAG